VVALWTHWILKCPFLLKKLEVSPEYKNCSESHQGLAASKHISVCAEATKIAFCVLQLRVNTIEPCGWRNWTEVENKGSLKTRCFCIWPQSTERTDAQNFVCVVDVVLSLCVIRQPAVVLRSPKLSKGHLIDRIRDFEHSRVDTNMAAAPSATAIGVFAMETLTALPARCSCSLCYSQIDLSLYKQ
jgi:hypothetical protein